VVAEKAEPRAADLVRRVAPSRSAVLIRQAVMGRELVVCPLHYWRERVGQPFVAANRKAFAEGVLEASLRLR
jgi:transcriptional regulator with GAF, ATPase, and Fis domain